MTLLCQYHYDALDRLIGHTPANEAPLQRFYCKSRLATEIQGALRHSIVQHGDLLLAQQQSAGDARDTTLLATDQQRSVLQILKGTQPPLAIAYSPYGHHRPENGLLSLLGFNGEQPDPVTGHYLLGNGYRAFNPVLMRFNSPDSWSPFGKGGLNPYAYCLGDPINMYDKDGHFSLPSLVSKLFRTWFNRPNKFVPPKAPKIKPIYRNGGDVTFEKTLYKNGPTSTNITKDTITEDLIYKRYDDADGLWIEHQEIITPEVRYPYIPHTAWKDNKGVYIQTNGYLAEVSPTYYSANGLPFRGQDVPTYSSSEVKLSVNDIRSTIRVQFKY